jgi:hypothetical protein
MKKSKKKEKEIEVEVQSAGSMFGPSTYDHKPTVSVEPIKNGYVIRSCCSSGEDAEFASNLLKAPAIIERLINVGNKSAREIKEMTR